MSKLKVVGAGGVPVNGRTRVLVVDDNLDYVHATALLIKMFGFQVQFAINAFGAIDVARRFRPNVILLDMSLPGMDGDELARQLRFEPGLEETRIIGVSGHGDDETRKRALEAGCTEFHLKPMAPDVLERSLRMEITAAPAARSPTG